MLYLATLLAETLAVEDARAELTEQVLRSRRLGDTLRARVADHLAYLDPAALADVLTAGLAHEELRISSERPGGLVYTLMDRHDFVIDPLPNLLFTRDSSLWIGDRVGVTSLAMPARRRETTLTDAIYRHHPRFAGTEFVYRPDLEHLEGGDVLLLAPGVLAVGVGERTTRPVRNASAGRSSPPGWPTPSWWCRSPRSAPPCTWTPSARWSTWTPC
ncbi:hypothetical protein GCM10027614_50090 [Micromonospora vulcania]